MDYPIWNLAMGGGVLMAWVAITHVIVSHFAIGGGLIIVVTETLAVRRSDPELRELARRSSLVLILVSTVFGAISGVGIWVVAGLISPGAIAALIHNYVWGWAIEWVFFVIEIVAALVYYTTWDKISKGAHLMVGRLYFISAYLSLVIINGIITFMLTPGEWLSSHAFWDGFFNPTYWPSLVLRTGICILMAVAFMLWPAFKTGADRRSDLVRYLGWWFLGGVLLSYAGYRWWEAALPDTVKALFLGEAPTLAGLAATRSFTLWSLALGLAVTVLALLLAPKLARGLTAVVLMVGAFRFFRRLRALARGHPQALPDPQSPLLQRASGRARSIRSIARVSRLTRAGWRRVTPPPKPLAGAFSPPSVRAATPLTAIRASARSCRPSPTWSSWQPTILRGRGPSITVRNAQPATGRSTTRKWWR